MARFYGLWERVTSSRAIVELHDSKGQWSGTYRVEKPRYGSLYEECYRVASREAALKGGTLERFSEAEAL